MFIIQQFTLILMVVIIFISPLMNIYFVVKNVESQPKKRIVTAFGIGLYILFLSLFRLDVSCYHDSNASSSSTLFPVLDS